MKGARLRLGLRGRLALSIAAIVLAAVAVVFIAVHNELGEVAGALLIGGGIAVAAALIAGYQLAVRVEETFARQRQFVSDASHELRTPLTAIRGQLEVLARSTRPEPEEVRRVERLVLTEMARIERLVDDLLTLARLDETVPLERRKIPLVPYLRRLAEDESLGGVAVGELPAGTLRADPDRLTQVIRNLLGNARRHAGAAGRVAISAAARGSRLTIRVDDDGPGIEPAERERVFTRFHRSEAARDRGSGGSGLGLAIARSIVELHGGRIWVEDSPLGGARVAFELDGFEPQLGTA